MPFDPNAVSLKRAYDKNLITEVLPSDTILVFRGDNETNYQTYRLAYEQLLILIDENNLFFGVYVDKPALDLITGISGSFAIVYNDIIAPVLYVWNATDSIWVELTSGSSIIGVANTDDLPEAIEGTNLYFTPERVRHSFPRSDLVISKPPTSGGEVYMGTVTLYDQFKILSFVSSIPCRFRLYATSAYRTADELRTANTLPVGNHGCILDSALGVSNTDNFLVTPNILVSSESPYSNEFFYTIDTLGGGDVEVDVTLEIVVISEDYFPS